MRIKILFLAVVLFLASTLIISIKLKNDQISYFKQRNSIGCCSFTNIDNFSTLNVIKRNTKQVIYNFLNPWKWFQKKNRPNYLFLLSENDKFFFDSITSIAVDERLLKDELKKNREISLIFNDTSYNVKVKLRGSDPTTHFWGVHSIKVESQQFINERKIFNIISGLEFDYRNVFFNLLATSYEMYTEQVGEIISFNFNNTLHDGYLYQDFDYEFVLKNYNDTLYNVFKNFKNVNSHTSEFDNLYYNNEKKINTINGHLLGIKKNKKFKSGRLDLNNYEKDYFATFLALIYLLGDSYQITGDNLEILHINRNLVPLFRKESHIARLNIEKEGFDNSVFSHIDKAQSHSNFKRLVLNNEFRYLRNKKLKILLSDKEKIISTFDSVYNSNLNMHKLYNSRFFDQKIYYELMRENLINNFNKISDYFKNSKSFFSFENDTLKIVSDSYVRLSYIINDSFNFSHQPRSFFFEGDEIKSSFLEKKINFKDKIYSLKVVNEFTMDTLNYNYINDAN